MMRSSALSHAFRRLHEPLRVAVRRASEVYHTKPDEDPFRGTYVELSDAERVVEGPHAATAHPTLEAWQTSVAGDPLYRWLCKTYPGFDPADYLLLLLALAPEYDSAYERVFGYLHDDVTRRRPTVELAVRLLDPGGGGDEVFLRRLAHAAPLMTNRLLELVEPADGRTGVLSQVLRPDEQLVRRLYGVPTLDRRLRRFTTLSQPRVELDSLVLPEVVHAALKNLIPRAGDPAPGPPARLYLYGPDPRLNARVAEALARRGRLALLTVDVGRLLASDRGVAENVQLLAREALHDGALLLFDGLDPLQSPNRRREWAELNAELASSPQPLVLTGLRPSLPPAPAPLPILAVELPLPDVDQRVGIWAQALEQLTGRDPCAPGPYDVTAEQVHTLAADHVLSATHIEQAVGVAAVQARWRAAANGEPPGGARPRYEELAAAARVQGLYELESLTHKIEPRACLTQLVVRPEVLQQLREIVARVRRRHWVLNAWGFGRRQSYGHGVSALFAGPSGTGKTVAAEAVAHELHTNLYRIDLASVVSKYIGETEQRLEQIFLAGEATQAVLFFDEADSLLGKRSEVRDAHDRYANIEVSYLLQRMERYDGLIILATNLPGNLDDAFLRRIAVVVNFKAPRQGERRRLWDLLLPPHDSIPFLDRKGFKVDRDYLAERFELTGGGIRNAALTAAYAAADREEFPFVTMWDVLIGVRRELEKLGQSAEDEDLGLDRPDIAVPPPHRLPTGVCAGDSGVDVNSDREAEEVTIAEGQ
jgi:hypothetical protein